MTARPRDPEARTAAILDSATALVAERGVGNVSHRAIADRAGVPLGSTTYYFPSLVELVNTALERHAERSRAEVAAWRPMLVGAADLASTLTGLAVDYLEHRDRALIEYELYLAAARDDRLRGHARAWLAELTALLTDVTDADRAATIAAQLDGFTVQALALGQPFDAARFDAAVRALLR